ncbi:amino acid ABC transporter substrate-binding protein [Thalassotalea sp. M1531]|uniref:Amino acid ABC transporter substrate-binding protein n=1 Tax=Thalassotalea algicola TaxID=2716224 RepID=A0A7Y0LDS7_9GAMM|nr:amino acid ABC transporter substrate-binding protein [Thalassotalea algicola]NMP32698.1 amino acid ABC transporter substrate-binding protein [Thalassotalea algicola]
MHMRIFSLLFLLCTLISHDVWADTIVLAVGPDHQEMHDNNYAIYRANWEFLSISLKQQGYKLEARSMPWARAKDTVKSGQSHGLFLAANFAGRDQWASLSKPLGYEVYGCFFHKENAGAQSVIAAVRLGQHDRILSYLSPDKLLNVTTAQKGLTLLHKQKVDRFIVAQSYGEYILANELSSISAALQFDPNQSERRSLHVAFAKNNESSLNALAIVNNAISYGVSKGFYSKVMQDNQVPLRMQFNYDL